MIILLTSLLFMYTSYSYFSRVLDAFHKYRHYFALTLTILYCVCFTSIIQASNSLRNLYSFLPCTIRIENNSTGAFPNSESYFIFDVDILGDPGIALSFSVERLDCRAASQCQYGFDNFIVERIESLPTDIPIAMFSMIPESFPRSAAHTPLFINYYGSASGTLIVFKSSKNSYQAMINKNTLSQGCYTFSVYSQYQSQPVSRFGFSIDE